jgi:hypothetical protein
MNLRPGLFRLPGAPVARIALVGWVALLVPPLIFGPWLPLLDLVAFVGLGNYPATLSHGPLHYAVFQFTYIVHYAMSRAMAACGIGAGAQIVVFYLLQGVGCFAVVSRLLPRLVPEAWWAGLAVAVGTLAFWNGFFLWGGPLPFSLAATALAVATFCALREAEAPERCDRLLVPLLAMVAVACHPFALLFAVILAALRWVFVPARRGQTIALGAGLLVFGWIVVRDSPESGAASGVPGLFGWPLTQIPQRLIELFAVSPSFSEQLFGFCPAGLRIYFLLLGAIHLAGFVASPVVAVVARESRALRMLAALNSVVALIYLCSRQNDFMIPGWPWRILTFYSPFLFVAGIAAPAYLIRRWRPAWLRVMHRPAKAAWAVPVAVVGLLAVAQIPVLGLGGQVGRSYERTRGQILQSGVANAFVVITDIDAIQPFYLRSVPFLLFGDPQIVARNVHLFTEWHIQNRHPTRLAETWLDLGRPAYQAAFSTSAQGLEVRLVPQPAGQVPLPVGNNQGDRGGKPDLALMQFHLGNQLIQLGLLRDAILHYQAALRVNPGFAEVHNNVGVAYLNSQKLAEAAAHFQEAVRLKPGYVDAHANLGAVLLQSGRPAEAAVQFQQALQADPNHAGAREGMRRVTGK